MPKQLVEVTCNNNTSSWDTKLDGGIVTTYRTQGEAKEHAIELAKSLGATYRICDRAGAVVSYGHYNKSEEDIFPETIQLDKEGLAQFESDLANPPEPNEALRALFADKPLQAPMIETRENSGELPAEEGEQSELGVVDQVRLATRKGNRLATFLGCLLGGFVPLATYMVAHEEVSLDSPLWQQPLALLVLGGLIYSAATVYHWGRLGFASIIKALGFTVLLEGVMVFSGIEWLSYAALAYLMSINAIGTGVTLAIGQRK